MTVYTIFLFLFIALVTSAPSIQDDENTLVLLHVLFRHGNRTPDRGGSFPNDLYLNYTYEPYGHGQLTLKGKRTEYNIGAYMRKNYGDFIPNQYTSNVVDGLTTNLKRTKMSLELLLAGLFPPLQNEVIHPGLNWQPIPYNIESDGNLITPATMVCPNYLSAYTSYISSQAAQESLTKYKEFFSELTKYTGKEINNYLDVLGIYVTLKSEEDFGLELPEWTKKFYPKLLEDISGREYQRAAATSTLRKLSAGFLLKKILEDSYTVKNGTNDTKVFLYSAHEFNIGAMLNTLNVFHPHVPPFGATIFFEVHKIHGQYGLKLFYQDYTGRRPHLLTIPGCDSFCPLDQLSVLVRDSLPSSSTACTLQLGSY